MLKSLTADQKEMFPDLPTVPLKKRIRSRWEDLNELCDLVEKHGPLIPQAMAAELLDLSSQRISQLVAEGTLVPIMFRGKKWLSESQLRAFIEVQRKAGRPWKEPSKKELWKRSKAYAQAVEASTAT